MKTVKSDLLESFGIGMAFAVAAYLVAATSGCSGIEIGLGKVGIYRVDERQDSSRTYRNAVPFKCYFTSCAPSSDEAQGS